MYLFVINKKSGNGHGMRTWSKVKSILDSRQIAYHHLLTECPEEAEQRTAEMLHLTEDWKAVGVIGGDGTIHSVLPVLRGSGIPLAVIPAGSGNDTARGFNIPRDTASALEIMLTGRTRSADLISTSGVLTLTAVAIGFDAQVAENVNLSMYKKICNFFRAGRLAYIIGILHTLLTFKPCKLTVHCDGGQTSYPSAWMAAISNVTSYGGGLDICPQADPGDGHLDICIVHGCTRLQLLRLFPTVLLGKHVTLPFVTMLRGKNLIVLFNEERLALGDGENMSTLPFDIHVDPGALQVCVG
ncbi:diacylglycerol/lipid kinase family protein [Paenibacillus pini]